MTRKIYTITATEIAQAAAPMIAQAATTMRPDVLAALKAARTRETNERAQRTLDMLSENAAIAAADDVPFCQDTGTLSVLIEEEPGVHIEGNIRKAFVAMMRELWPAQGLRASTVLNPITRINPGDNTPAFIDTVRIKRIDNTMTRGVRLSVLLKGAGSDNASRVLMLNPAHGVDEIEAEIVALVREKGAVACPPQVIAIGIGSTFDKVGLLSKHAFLRPIDELNPNPELAAIEDRLLAAVNATGVGPAGLGGDTTALRVLVETAPCHIAALPVAINLGCNALRTRTTRIAAHKAYLNVT